MHMRLKSPNGKSAKKILEEEAKILSYLSRVPSADEHIVGFYGQDTRTGALVLEAMDVTLEDWISNNLNTLPEPDRTKKLADVFPALALKLLNGLEWMTEKKCVHADIKHSNILLSETSPSDAVYSDFSSATLSALSTPDGTPTSQLGGGTWDFLDPALVAKASPPASPSASTDLWALGLTLLWLVIGISPFDCATNTFQRRELIKHGNPLSYAIYGDDGPKNFARIKALSKELGFDVQKWFAKVLTKDVAKRVGVEEWKLELENAMRTSAISKI